LGLLKSYACALQQLHARYLSHLGDPMSAFERLLVPGNTELPECRCGKEMQIARVDEFPDRTDAQIRVYNCSTCHHEMRLTVWSQA
jgi:hypothetical protein